MATLESVDEVNQIFVGGSAVDEEIVKVNQALSEGWRLLEVYAYHSGDPRERGAIGTVYVLGRPKRHQARTTALPGPGASGPASSPSR